MNRKKNVSAFVSVAAGLMLLSCSTLKDSGKDVYTPLNYSEDRVLETEIESVKKMQAEKPVMALWRSYLLTEKFQDKENVGALFSECGSRVVELLDQSMEEKDGKKPSYYEALKFRRSLDAVKFPGLENKVSCREIMNSLANSLPVKAGKTSAKATIGDYINGTVTVYVDKGLKIERGLGHADAVLGSGFFVTKDGYIVTNHHVIKDMVDKDYEGYARLYIKLADDPDTRIPAKVVGYDSVLDIALLKTEIEAPYVFSLGSSSELEVGKKIYVIGSPLGLEKTLTSGIISSIDRQIVPSGAVFQIDAAVNSGNSGGPMIDEEGRVQGIVFAGVIYHQGLNFAIPVEYLKMELDALFSGGERVRSWIGVYGKTKRLPGYGMKNEGIVIHYVLPGGTADRAGIRENDILTHINGIQVSSVDELKQVFMQIQNGTIVRLQLVRGEDESVEKIEKIVYLDTRPECPGYEIYKCDLIENALFPILGMKLVRNSTSNKKRFGVTEVLKGSAADENGFSENDPVEIVRFEMDKEKKYAYIQFFAKKRKNGYLDVGLGVNVAMDGPYYF